MGNKKILIFALVVVAGLTSVELKNRSKVEAQAVSVDWPQFQHDAQRTGRTTIEVAPNYQLAWAFINKTHVVKNFVSTSGKNITDGFETGFKFDTIVGKLTQPIIAYGKVYFGALNGTFYAVDGLSGDWLWEYQTQAPIIASAAYASGVVIMPSLDGSIYGLDATTGVKKWSVKTGAGVMAPPVLANGVAYLGSRDGVFYALDVVTGAVKWTYSAHAPIVSSAAISEDGSTVLFGAENMNFYGLNTVNGTEKWGPKKMAGQSFMYGWPVVSGNRVIVRTMSSLLGAEFLMESELDSLPACYDANCWLNEKAKVAQWLAATPQQKTMYVLDIATGTEPYSVAMGRVTGNNFTPFPPVLDNQNRVLTYWRSRSATFFSDVTSNCFGTKYCPDISGLDINNGNRIFINNPNSNRLSPELDNGFSLTVGGNYIYLANHFRGLQTVNLVNGNLTRITATSAKWDGADFRGWGVQIIYYGNDSQPSATYTNDQPPGIYSNTAGYAGIAVAQINSMPLLFASEGNAGGFIVAIKHTP